jgi:hypothetical protein
MKATMRRLTAQGLDVLLKQTKAASRESGKAFLSTQEANIEIGRIEFAKENLPVSDAATEIWDVEMPIVTVYKNALITAAIVLIVHDIPDLLTKLRASLEPNQKEVTNHA